MFCIVVFIIIWFGDYFEVDVLKFVFYCDVKFVVELYFFGFFGVFLILYSVENKICIENIRCNLVSYVGMDIFVNFV